MNRLVRGVALLVVAAASVACSSEWKQFTSASGGFRVSAPARLDKTVRKVNTAAGEMDMHTYVLQQSSSIYMIAYADYPAAMVKQGNLNDILDGGANGALRNIGGTGQAEKASFLGRPARKLSAKVSRSGFQANLRGIIFLKENRLYQLMLIAKKGEKIDALFSRFSASFVLTDGTAVKDKPEDTQE